MTSKSARKAPHRPVVFSRLYRYVGPADIAEHARGLAPGIAVRNTDDLRDALASLGTPRRNLTCTYVVDRLGQLRLADRASEHVACAGGGPVMAAGEITLAPDGEALDVSNQSTGFCPEVGCWPAMRRTLDEIGLTHPDEWSAACEFRRCPGCAGRTLVKDSFFECVECGSALPETWNFDKTTCLRATPTAAGAQWVIDIVSEAATHDQDRAAAIATDDALVLALADGAGGTGGGREAAELVVARATLDHSAEQLLRALDAELAATTGGQTTAVLLRLDSDGVTGASVGDSEAMQMRGGEWRELTEQQHRKPLLGSGRAVVEPFHAQLPDRLLVASDGLMKYASWPSLRTLLEGDGPDIPWALVDAARLGSGALQDDLIAIYARRR